MRKSYVKLLFLWGFCAEARDESCEAGRTSSG
jgi:hypothetical protein